MALPVVDLSPYLLQSFVYPPSDKQRECSAAIHKACLEFGFFYITGLGIPKNECDEVLRRSAEFFGLPDKAKNALSIASATNGTDGARGYQKLKVRG